MSERRTSAEIRQELEHAKFRHRNLLVEIGVAENHLAQLKKEANSIQDTSCLARGEGVLKTLASELKLAELFEAHQSLPTVVWITRPYFSDAKHHVVAKVTNKTIRVSALGRDDINTYKHDGTSRFGGKCNGVIDIRQTFGIDADSVPPNWKPTAAAVTA